MSDSTPTTGIIDPATGRPHPTSGPAGGPPGPAGTQARDVAGRATAGTEGGPQVSGSGDASNDAKDRAAEAAGAAKEQASGAADAAKEQVSAAAGQAQEKAQDAVGQARETVRQQLDERSTQAGERVTATAGDLRAVSDGLRERGSEAPAKLADQAALQVEKAGSYLQRTDGGSLLQDVEDFARRNPWAAALGGLAVGFAASRALKASSSQRRVSSGSAPTPSPAPASIGSGTAAAPATTAPPAPTVPASPGAVTAETPEITGYSVPHGAPGQPGLGTTPPGA